MIIIKNNVVYKFDVVEFTTIMHSGVYKSYGQRIETEWNKFHSEISKTCINQHELDIRIYNEMYLIDSKLRSTFMDLAQNVWNDMTEEYNVDEWKLDIKPNELDYHRDTDGKNDGGIINLDTNMRVECIACTAANMEYLQWADAVKRVSEHPLTSSVEDLVNVVSNNSDEETLLFKVVDDHDAEHTMTPEQLLDLAISKNPEKAKMTIPVLTHIPSAVLN